MEEQTLSVCPVCLKTIPAKRVKEEQNIYLEKTCPEHGAFRTLVWEGLPAWETWGEKKQATRPYTEEGVEKGCPNDCGLCGHHRQRTCCILLEVTHRCNLKCPVCFADSGREESDPPLSVIENWYDIVRKDAPGANIQLSGGEPTVRDDLDEIIRIGKKKGFTFFQLNTNGLRLAEDLSYVKKLKEAGLSCVFLQFDGFREETYKAFRGRPLLEEKLRAIRNCGEAGVGVVLVPVIEAGVNLDEAGEILRFAADHLPVVKGVHFQPISYFGRYNEKSGAASRERLTLPRLLREIEEQTGGKIRASYFTGGTAENPHCSFNGDFIVEEDGTFSPLKTGSSCCSEIKPRPALAWEIKKEEASCGCGTPAVLTPTCGCGAPAVFTSSGCCGEAAEPVSSGCCGEAEAPVPQSCCEPVTAASSGCCGTSHDDREATAVEHTRDMVAKRWGAPVSVQEQIPPDPNSMDGLIYRLKNRRFAVSAMAFMDCWSLDLDRLRDCYIHILSPEGKIVPFCSYNLTSAEGRPLHRK